MGASIKKIILFTLLFISTILSANIAKVVALKGDASIIREGKTLALTKKSIILKHDQIKTKDKTKVQLLFKDNTVISIGGNSSFQVFEYLFDEKNNKYEAKFSMLQGTFRTITGKIGKLSPKKFNLKTKSASIGIRGTQIVMNLSAEKEDIFCTEGRILVTKLNSNVNSFVKAGEFVSLKKNDITKIKVKKIKPSDINKINNKISIQNNLATDKISIQNDINIKPEETQEVEIQNTPTTTTSNAPEVASSTKTNAEDKAKEEEEKAAKEKADGEAAQAAAQAEIDAEEARIAAEQALADKAANDAEAARIAAEQAAAAKAAADAEAARIANEQAIATQEAADAEAERVAAAQVVEDKADADADAARIAKEQAEAVAAQAAIDAANQAAAATTAEEIAAAEQAAADAETARVAAEQAAADQAEADAEATRIATEQAAATQAAADAEAERVAAAQEIADQAEEDAEAARIAEEQAATAQAAADAEAATVAAAQAAAAQAAIDNLKLIDITSESYIENNNSTATYKGNFNNHSYDSKNQYIKRLSSPTQIPNNTTISMDIDFAATKDHISNGKIEVKDSYQNYYDTTFKFNGEIENTKDAKLKLEGMDNTTGKGKAYLYGDEANFVQGEVDFEDSNGIEIKGEFDALKEGFEDEIYITIDDITPESYFEDFNSTATYKGDFNKYSYDDKKQYLQNTNNVKVAIPSDTAISMDIDFAATEDHISNGKVNISDIGNGSSETLTFDGHIHENDSKFHIDPSENTSGSRGEGYFHGSEANIIKGDVNLESGSSNVEIKGEFDAKKQ